MSINLLNFRKASNLSNFDRFVRGKLFLPDAVVLRGIHISRVDATAGTDSVNESRVPKPSSRDYVKTITGDRLRPAQQAQLTTNANLYAIRMTWIGHALLLLALLFSMAYDLSEAIMELFRLSGWWRLTIFIGIIVVYAILSVLMHRYEHRFVRRYVGKQLKTLGVRPHFCVTCDYNLTGSESANCPECGATLAAHDSQIEDEDDDFAPID